VTDNPSSWGNYVTADTSGLRVEEDESPEMSVSSVMIRHRLAQQEPRRSTESFPTSPT
jgi:hypothetical protein